jgi:hypothetical protein
MELQIVREASAMYLDKESDLLGQYMRQHGAPIFVTTESTYQTNSPGCLLFAETQRCQLPSSTSARLESNPLQCPRLSTALKVSANMSV